MVALAPSIPKGQLYDGLNFYSQCISEIEHIGDHTVNLAELFAEYSNSGESFSDIAISELEIVQDAVKQIVDHSLKAITTLDVEAARKIEPLEEVIDDLVAVMRKNHIRRLHAGSCTTYNGLYFLETLTTLERISDHCSNIGLFTLSLYNKQVMESPHNYAKYLHSGADELFNEMFDLNYRTYFDRLNRLNPSEAPSSVNT